MRTKFSENGINQDLLPRDTTDGEPVGLIVAVGRTDAGAIEGQIVRFADIGRIRGGGPVVAEAAHTARRTAVVEAAP